MLRSATAPPRGVARIVAAIEPFNEVERSHQAGVLASLAGTPDVYRRVKPATPPMHLVSYAVLADQRVWSVFLVDHRPAGLWLPPDGHVEPGEEPAATAQREALEELGLDADFSIAGRRPVFVTIARTTGPDRHTDVSLWYLLAGSPARPIALDPREFTGGRWWTGPRIRSSSPERFDPNMGRFLAKIRAALG